MESSNHCETFKIFKILFRQFSIIWKFRDIEVNTIFCSTIEEALSKFQENQVDLFSFDIRGEEEKVLKDFFDKVDPFINQTLFITYYKSLERVPHYFREKKEIGVISRPLTSEGLLGFLGEKGKNLSLKNCEINREGNQKCRVYICEDSDLLRNYYSTTIEEWFEENNKRIPFEVMSFSTGEDLIKEAQAKPPDILLSDINLESAGGVMDGFDIIREIKSMNDGCSIFIISNHSKEEMGEKVLGCGAKGYLELPVEREHIVGIFSFLGINKGR